MTQDPLVGDYAAIMVAGDRLARAGLCDWKSLCSLLNTGRVDEARAMVAAASRNAKTPEGDSQ
jgi:hypothetical protein